MREQTGRRSDRTEPGRRSGRGAAHARRALPRRAGIALTRRGWTSLVTALCLLAATGIAALGWIGLTTGPALTALPDVADPVAAPQDRSTVLPSPPAPPTPSPPTPSTPSPSSPAPTKDNPAPSRAGSPSASIVIPTHGSGRYTRATTTTIPAPPTRGRIIRYAVQVEKEVAVDANEAAAFMVATFADKRSWGGDGSLTFVFTPKGRVDVTAYISTPDSTDKLCLPSDTHGEVSCRNGDTIALNALRWTRGVPHFDGDLTTYKQYLVNHEFGHFIGYGHVGCPAKGRLAPVMLQQTHGLQGCRKNAWPFPDR